MTPVAVVDPRYVYEDLLTILDDGKRYELLEGDLLVSPSAKPRHQKILGNVFVMLRKLQDAGLGEAYSAPLDVVFDRHNVFEPDVLFIRTERLDIMTEKNVTGPPDLVGKSSPTARGTQTLGASSGRTIALEYRNTGRSTRMQTWCRFSAGKTARFPTRAP